MKIRHSILLWIMAFFIVVIQTAWAAGSAELVLEKRITALAPVFMPGHRGAPEWIQGFSFEGNIFVKGNETKIGNFSGEVSLLNPPMRDSEAYDQGFISMSNDIPGVGTFQVTALGLALGNSGNDGTTLFSWSGSMSNGTGSLQNLYGLSSGNASANLYTSSGTMTEVWNIRIGY